MMNEIKVFENPRFGKVRTFTEPDGTLLYCASDVAKGLEYTNPAKAVGDHCRGVTKRYITDSLGREQLASFLPKSDVLRLIASSRLPAAQEFEHWLFDEVAVSVVDTGMYMNGEALNRFMTDPNTMLTVCQNWKADRLKLEAAQAKIEADAPRVRFAQDVEGSENSVLVGTLAKLLKQNGVEIGEKRLFQRMRDDGYLCSEGERRNVPSQRAMGMKLFEVTQRTFSAPDGTTFTRYTTKVTGKGQVYFLNRYGTKDLAKRSKAQ